MTTGASWTIDMWTAIARALPQLGTEARFIVLAHAAYESGFGRAKAAVRGFNVFNITAGASWKGQSWTDVGGDTEYDAQGNVRRITQEWRIYPNLDGALADYWQFLGRSRYLRAREALQRGDVTAFVRELYAGGYFTLPPEKYLAGLAGTLTSVKGAIS